MDNRSVFFFLTLLASLAALAVPPVKAQELDLDLGIELRTKYVFRGFQQTGDVIIPQMSARVGGATFGIRHIAPVESENFFDTQTDFFARYEHRLSDRLTVEGGVTRFDFDAPGADTTEVFAGLALDHEAAPKIRLYYNTDLELWTGEFSAAREWLMAEATKLRLSGSLGSHHSDNRDAQYLMAEAAVIRDFSERLSGHIGAGFGANSEEAFFSDAQAALAGDFEKTGLWLSAGLTATN